MKRLLILVALVLSVALTQWAQSPRELFAKNLKVSASNSYAYPSADLPKLTPAPKGYKPFYIDHYGRHGSRWLVSTKQYSIPVEQLAIAERNGKLTERGKELLSVLREMKDDSNNRLGDLTDLGAEQHRGIAQRMYRNFPAVFADSASIDARATVVIRCVLSMENELQELRMLNPKLKIFHDASQADMHYMNYNDTVVRNKRKFVDNTVAKFGENKVNPDYMLGKLFTDMKFAHDSIDAKTLITNLFDVIGNMQSHKKYENISFFDIFSQDEIYGLWESGNVFWYLYSGASPLTNGRMPYSQANLLRNMIESADNAIATGKNGAALRFGHEVCLTPLACLMELNNCGAVVDNLDELGDKWQDYKIFPMGCNIQMIFYRKPGNKDILVKVLLNEHEAKLPIATNMAPYYHWDELKAYYLNKLAKQKN